MELPGLCPVETQPEACRMAGGEPGGLGDEKKPKFEFLLRSSSCVFRFIRRSV